MLHESLLHVFFLLLSLLSTTVRKKAWKEDQNGAEKENRDKGRRECGKMREGKLDHVLESIEATCLLL